MEIKIIGIKYNMTIINDAINPNFNFYILDYQQKREEDLTYFLQEEGMELRLV